MTPIDRSSPFANPKWSIATALGLWAAVIRSVAELAIARYRFARIDFKALAKENHLARTAPQARELDVPGPVARVSYIIPRVAGYVPWRSDCLVQTLAAQRWLGKAGYATRIVIGIDRAGPAGFEAHAWLKYKQFIVTGGEIERFSVLLEQPESEK